MKRIIKIIVPILACSIALSSCSEEIELELNDGDNNHLVIEGVFTTVAKQHYVKLTRTTSYYYTESAPVEIGASVSITDGENTIELLDEDNDGVYLTSPEAKAEIGKTYTLNVKLANGEEYSATDIVPQPCDFASVYYEFTDMQFGFDIGDPDYFIFCSLQDMAVVNNYFLFDLYLDGEKVNKEAGDAFLYGCDENINGAYVSELQLWYFEEDEITKDSCNLRTEMLNVSKEYYEFVSALCAETVDNSTIMQGPPANIPTNVTNGGLGFFGVASVSTIDTVIKKHD